MDEQASDILEDHDMVVAVLREEAEASDEERVASVAPLVDVRAVEGEADGEGWRLRVTGSHPVARGQHVRGRDRVARAALTLVRDRVDPGRAVHVPPAELLRQVRP